MGLLCVALDCDFDTVICFPLRFSAETIFSLFFFFFKYPRRECSHYCRTHPHYCYFHIVSEIERLSSTLPINMSPYQMLFNKQSDIGNNYTFGCDVYIRVDDTLRTDMDPKSTLRYYLGPNSEKR